MIPSNVGGGCDSLDEYPSVAPRRSSSSRTEGLMSDSIDFYHKWLGIPADQRPPNHYQLLGLQEFESDSDVIVGSADRQMRHLRTFQIGRYSDESQRLLNEVA